MSGYSDDTPIRLSSSTYALRGLVGLVELVGGNWRASRFPDDCSCSNRELDERSEKDDVTGLQKRPVPDDA